MSGPVVGTTYLPNDAKPDEMVQECLRIMLRNVASLKLEGLLQIALSKFFNASYGE